MKYDMDFELERPFAENILKAFGDLGGRPATQAQFERQVDAAITRAARHGYSARQIYDALRVNSVCYGIPV